MLSQLSDTAARDWQTDAFWRHVFRLTARWRVFRSTTATGESF